MPRADCEKLCTADASCKAIDYGVTNQKCYLVLHDCDTQSATAGYHSYRKIAMNKDVCNDQTAEHYAWAQNCPANCAKLPVVTSVARSNARSKAATLAAAKTHDTIMEKLDLLLNQLK